MIHRLKNIHQNENQAGISVAANIERASYDSDESIIYRRCGFQEKVLQK